MKIDMIEQVAITASNHITVKAIAAALVSVFAYSLKRKGLKNAKHL